MGQALSDLATTFNFDFPSQQLDSASSPTFKFAKFKAFDLPRESGKVNLDVDTTFSLVLADQATFMDR